MAEQQPAPKVTRTHDRTPVRTIDERQAVRLIALVVGLLALCAGVVCLAIASYAAALGCLVLAIAAGLLAGTMFGQLHQEELARIARAQASRAMPDPFSQE
jgi:uncharacterized membrane protein